jgi:hypothetical protein
VAEGEEILMPTHNLDRPVNAKGVVHRLVADTAKEIAAADWEGRASASDKFYKAWPNVNAWVRRRWQSYIQIARETLAEMLDASKHYMTTEAQRQEIHEALLLNAGVNPASNLVDEMIDGSMH